MKETSTPLPRADLQDSPPPDPNKPTYKSWKKKYRKMRVNFDHKMQECEDLHKQETHALAMVKRIAIENDRILDLLCDINRSDQIPLDKRVDVTLVPGPKDKYVLDTGKQQEDSEVPKPTKTLQELLKEVPHPSFEQAKELFPSVLADMEPFAGESEPPSFLTAADIDDYLYDIDMQIDENATMPTLAPKARSNNPSITNTVTSQNIALRNPTSVYNWLRKHAPKTFLQDAEGLADKDDKDHEEAPVEGKRKRQSTAGGSAKAERSTAKASRGGKRRSTAADKAALAGDVADGNADDDNESVLSTPAATSSRAANKRKRDDDAGYRPKGGSSSRPAKKKRKSTGDGEAATPTAKSGGSSRRSKSRMSEAAKAEAEAEAEEDEDGAEDEEAEAGGRD